MPSLDEARAAVAALFREPRILDSRSRWQAAGFDVVPRDDNDKIMVAAHSQTPSFMFKCFANGYSRRGQRHNFRTRVAGITALRKLADARGLTRVALPQKWIVDLPAGFDRQILVVERLDLLKHQALHDAYARIDEGTLKDLCVLLHAYRGLDSGTRNLPLTVDGRAAFVDTERWEERSGRKPLKDVRRYLTRERKDLVDKLFDKLDRRHW